MAGHDIIRPAATAAAIPAVLDLPRMRSPSVYCRRIFTPGTGFETSFDSGSK